MQSDRNHPLTICSLLCTLALLACEPGPQAISPDAPTPEPEPTQAQSLEPVDPLEAPQGLDPAQVELGGRLFHDPRLSLDGKVSCSSCHNIAQGGDDGRPVFLGVGGVIGGINSPTVLNSSLNFVQFWNGRAATLEEQAAGPMTAAKEMGSNWLHILKVVQADPDYARGFAQAFPDGVTQDNILTCVATFERSLITPNARFDRWLRGDKQALTSQEVQGYELFKSAGCIACHQGRGLGGNMFQKFGVIGNYMEDRGQITDADLGRFAVTGKESDRFVFKVPSLRNIERTAPYLHDGSAQTLEEAVQIMGHYQLGRPLSEEEVGRLVAFLKTLSGDIPDVSAHQAWVDARLPQVADSTASPADRR